MIIEDVRLEDLEQNIERSPYYYRARVMKITTDRGAFFTPARFTARSEYLARSGVPLSKALPLELAIDFRELDDTQVSGILENNTIAERVLRVTKQFNDITNRTILRISVFQPPATTLEKMSSEKKIEFAQMQAEYLQQRLGTNIITYPFLDLPLSEYKKLIGRAIINDNTFPIFTLDMKKERNYLKELIDHLIKSRHHTLVILIYRNWQKSIPQHHLIGSYFRNDGVAFIAAQVEREENENHTSNLHSVVFWGGFDMVSLMQSRGHADNHKLSLNKIRFLNPNDLRTYNIEDTLGTPERDLVQELDLPSDEVGDRTYVAKILNGYKGALSHWRKFKILYYLARTHESIVSPAIFERTRNSIKKKIVSEYIEQTSLEETPLLKIKHS
jgi:hypothetical protein